MVTRPAVLSCTLPFVVFPEIPQSKAARLYRRLPTNEADSYTQIA